jgi:transcriptional regulator with XRE-family HTH domain
MREASYQLSIGDRVAFFRRRRGLTQETLAGLVGRTASWLEKIESGRAPLDRISVVRDLASALDVSFGDLVAEGVAAQASAGRDPEPELSLAYRALNPGLAEHDEDVQPLGACDLRRLVADVWTAYQDARWRYLVQQLNRFLPAAYDSSQRGEAQYEGTRTLAHLYHAAEGLLVKLGRLDEAWVCAENGEREARQLSDPVLLTSLHRGVAHALLSSRRYADAVMIVRDRLVDAPAANDSASLSATGTLMLVGATASARAGERSEAMTFLRHAQRLADQLARDANEMWTAFGPTNVAIHRVTVAAELGDLHTAASLGTSLDVRAMPRERRVRHQLEVGRALFRIGSPDESVRVLLDAERAAPEHVRRHFLTNMLVRDLMRTIRTRPSPSLVALAGRLGHAA